MEPGSSKRRDVIINIAASLLIAIVGAVLVGVLFDGPEWAAGMTFWLTYWVAIPLRNGR
jgi:hypothetical protein